MVAYVFHYFNTPGRGEFLRLLLIAAGQLFTDDRVEGGNWPALKPNTPWGSLPYLEVDGKALGQTKAIARYIAHQHGLGGSGAWEQGLVDSAVEASRDILDLTFQYNHADDSQREKILNKLKNNTLPTILGKMEQFIQQNGKNGFSVGEKLTSADLALFDALDQVQNNPKLETPNPAENYPKIKEVLDKVKADSKIAPYLSRRPPTTPFVPRRN